MNRFALVLAWRHPAPLAHTANKASLAIWDKLGFSRVGEIPAAGRLVTGKTETGEDVEEYVDAVIVWKSFV